MLRQRGLLGNTLVVIASDHGEHLGTHGLWGHRFLTYQDLARVALQIREPGRRQGVRVSTPVQLSDLYVTVLNATLRPLPDQPIRDTRDLLAIAARDGEPRVAVCECNGPAPTTMRRFEGCTDPVVLHRATCQIAAVGPRFKLIRSADGERELYDLREDPGELHNLIDERPEEAKQLGAYVRAWLEATPAYAGPSEAGKSSRRDALDSLRALGYVGDN
jgi:arylsulfatase A-like enzyme